MKKKVCILSPDAIKLPLTDNAPEYKYEGELAFNLKEKCCNATALGRRAQRFAEFLSKHFNVTLLIPDLNYPGKEFINTNNINYTIDSYSWSAANWEYSEELHKKLINFDVIIIQTTTGTGFKNCAELPKDIRVICDAWVPFPVEFPWALQSYTDDSIRQLYWTRGMDQYKKLMKRADCIIYANNRQKSFYDGFFMFECSKQKDALTPFTMIKIPLGMDENDFKVDNFTKDVKLLWWGPIYPWYDAEILLEGIKDVFGVTLTFSGVEHPRFKKLFTNKYKDILNKYNNITISTSFTDNLVELFNNFDFGIILGKNSLENFYSHRCRIVDMLSCGLPVITDSWNSFNEDTTFERCIYKIDATSIRKDLEKLVYNYKLGRIPSRKEIFQDMRRNMLWENIIVPLVLEIER